MTGMATNTPVPAATNTPVPAATNTPVAIGATATTTPVVLPSQQFMSTANFAPSSIAKGSTVAVNAGVMSTKSSTARVTLEVYDGSGARVFQQIWDGQAFSANAMRTFTGQWTVPAASGSGNYTAKVGVSSDEAVIMVH
jgi:hypothetical protein